jgi:hypothetical protein
MIHGQPNVKSNIYSYFWTYLQLLLPENYKKSNFNNRHVFFFCVMTVDGTLHVLKVKMTSLNKTRATGKKQKTNFRYILQSKFCDFAYV